MYSRAQLLVHHVAHSAIDILVFFMDQHPTFTNYVVRYVIFSTQTTFTVVTIFYTHIHSIQGSSATRSRVLLNVKESRWSESENKEDRQP